jgi:c-di-GMP-binding flagellar brake protein YcgR
VGTAVGRIVQEFVLRSLVDQLIPVQIHGNRKELEGVITAVDERSVDVAVSRGDTSGIEEAEPMRVFFHFQNNYHTFTAEAAKAEGVLLRLTRPDALYRNVKRKYERLAAPAGIQISFSMLGEDVQIHFPKSAEARAEGIEPKRSSGGGSESHDIPTLIGEFRARVGERVSDNKIVMLRDRPASTLFEKLLVTTRKSLWLPSTEEEFPFYDPFPDERIIVKLDLRKVTDEGSSTGESLADNILFRRASADAYSDLYCPILYREYVAGYIHLSNHRDRRQKIGEDLVEETYEFARVLSYALQVNGYFRTEGEEDDLIQSSVIDMSASGLLFTYAGPRVVEELQPDTEIDLLLETDARQLTVGARVMRRFADNDNYFFGVEFVRISPDDFEYLFEYLYGKAFSSEFAEVVEGGLEGRQ